MCLLSFRVILVSLSFIALQFLRLPVFISRALRWIFSVGEEEEEEHNEESQEIFGEDQISELPYDILASILSLLDTKDAVKTSILSHRWRYVWLRIPHLKLDLCNMFGRDYDIDNLNSREALEDCETEFIRRGNCVIEQYKRRGTTIRSLQVEFLVDATCPSSSSSLDKWLRFAIQTRAEKIALLLSRVPSPFISPSAISSRKTYKVPDWLFTDMSSTLKHLILEGCLVDHKQGDFVGLRNLTSLTLDNLTIQGDLMTHILSCAVLLRDVNIMCCYFMGRKFHLVGSSLIHLKFFYCEGLDHIKISSPILATLSFFGHAFRLSLVEAPSLSTVTFCSRVPSQHHLSALARIPQLETLQLFIDEPQVKSVSESTRVSFTSLKLLGLLVETCAVGDLSWFPTILRSCPALEKLVVQFGPPLSGPEMVIEVKLEMQKPLERFIHKKLKDVRIGGCCGTWFETEIEKFVFEVAVNLERMVISHVRRVLSIGGQWSDVQNVDYFAWYNSERETVLGMLQNRVPPGVNVTVV